MGSKSQKCFKMFKVHKLDGWLIFPWKNNNKQYNWNIDIIME